MSIKTSAGGNGIQVLTIDRPPVNALDENQVNLLSDAFREAVDDPTIRVIVLTGAGNIFVAGADMDKLLAAGSSEARDMVAGIKSLHRAMREAKKPVIAAINGMAAGGGLELALACDIRIAAPEAKMGLPEVKLGVLPGAGGTQILPRLIGIGRAMKLMLEGRIIDAQTAYDYGLVDQLATQGSALDEAIKTAASICRNAPLSVAEIKAAAWDTLSLPLDTGLETETERFCRVCGSEDKNEGITAFKEKRQAIFSGR